MEPISILLLVASAVVSFGLGRTVVRWRSKKRKEQLHLSAEQARLSAGPDIISANKSKRKRQLSKARRTRP